MTDSIFLRAKHWQIFIPLIAIPFITMIIFSILTAFVMVNNVPNRPEDVLWITYLMPFIMLLSASVQFGWFWNVLTKLSKLVPNEVRMPIKRMKLFFFIPLVYFCILPLFIGFVIRNTTNDNLHPGTLINVVIAGIVIFFLHLFSMFCIFHTIYFVAKTIRSAEIQRNATFSDFTGDFFLIWFFPIGVWFIQPRINKLIQESNGNLNQHQELVDQI